MTRVPNERSASIRERRGMTFKSIRLALFTAAVLAPTSARADGNPVRVLVRGPIEPAAVAAGIALELGVATSIVTDDDACFAPCAVVTVDESNLASIQLRGAAGVQMRSMELPESDDDAAAVVALVIGNLARDESAALIASLTPPPAPAPTPVPTPSPSPAPERPRAHGVSLGFVPPFAVDIAGSDGPAFDLVAGAHDRTTGFSISAVGSAIGEVHGAQIGGAVTVAGRVDGAQVGGAVSVARDVRGTQVAGALSVARDIRGAQIAGALAIAREVHGTQIAGAAAIAQGDVDTQVSGALNVAGGRMRGVQVSGALNIAGRVDGVQVGVVNIARAGDGASFGLINIVRGGRTELEGTLDDHAVGALVLRHGGRRWHNVYGVAARAERSLLDDNVTDDDMWMYGLGFGPTLHTGDTTVDLEAMAWQVIYGDDFTHDLDLLAQLRLVVGHRVGPASVVVGGALNTYVTTDEARTGYGARIIPGSMPPASTMNDDVRVEIWPSVFAGVRL
jgi:hypothetical protein